MADYVIKNVFVFAPSEQVDTTERNLVVNESNVKAEIWTVTNMKSRNGTTVWKFVRLTSRCMTQLVQHMHSVAYSDGKKKFFLSVVPNCTVCFRLFSLLER